MEAEDASLAAVVTELDEVGGEAWLMFVFRARAEGAPAGDAREGEAAWVAIADLPDLPKPPADGAILDAALAPSGLVFIRVTMDGGRLAGLVVHPVPALRAGVSARG